MRKFRIAACALVLGGLLGASLGTAQPPAAASGRAEQWPTYGGNLASQRYSSLDQIDKDNFKDLRIAWRLRTDFLGPRPDTLYSATPLYVNDTLYTTAGTRRAVVALDPATGEMKWLYREDEGARGSAGARQGAGRGVAWWSSPDGTDQRIIYVTPGYRMIALDAKTGIPVDSFGDDGIVDLKENFDQDGRSGRRQHRAQRHAARGRQRGGRGRRASPGRQPRIDLGRTRQRARFRRADRQTPLDLPYRPGSRRVRLRDVGRRRGGAKRQHRSLVANERGSGARARVSARRDAVLRLQRLQPPRRRTVRRIARGGRRAHRPTPVALPDGASRPLGLRPAVRADSFRHAAGRPHDQGAGTADQAGVPVRAEPRNGRTDLAHRRTARAAVGVTVREDEPHAAVSDAAATVRPPGFLRGRAERSHARAARRGRESHGAVPHRPSVHTGGDRSSGGPAGDAHAASRCRRRQLARRQLRSRDEPPLHSLAYGGLHAAEHPRQSHSRSTRVRLRARAPLRWRPLRRRRRQAVASARDPAHWDRNRGQEVLGRAPSCKGPFR